MLWSLSSPSSALMPWCITFYQNTNIPNQTLWLATVQCQDLFGQSWIFISHKLWLCVSLGCMLDVDMLKSNRRSDTRQPEKYQADSLQSCVAFKINAFPHLLMVGELRKITVIISFQSWNCNLDFLRKKKGITCLFLGSHSGGLLQVWRCLLY